MDEFFTDLTWQDVAAAIGVIFGIISTIAYIDQRRSNRHYKALFKFAELNVDKNLTDSEILELKERKNTLSEEVTDKIPTIGRIAVLQEQLLFYKKNIFQYYQSLTEIKEKLETLSQEVNINDISPELRKYIIDEISPELNKERRVSLIRDKIIAFLGLIIVIGIIVPFSVAYYIRFSLGIILIYDVLRYFVLKSKNENEVSRLYNLVKGLIFLTGISLFLFVVLIVIFNWPDYKDGLDVSEWLTIGTGILGLILASLSGLIIRIIRGKISEST